MKIGIDIDDTVVKTFDIAIKYADRYDKEVLSGKGRLHDIDSVIDSFYLQYIYGWDDDVTNDFFDRYYDQMIEEVPMIEEASYYINKLKEEGNQIIFITARSTNSKKCKVEYLTKKSLDSNNIPYDKVIFDARDKLVPCRDNEIDVFIDDNYEVCKNLYDNGFKVYLMNSSVNKNMDEIGMERVFSWKEIYFKIKEYEQIKI